MMLSSQGAVSRNVVGLAALMFSVAACGGTHRPRPAPATVSLGACADPGKDGVLGSAPRVERADRDLNGDGVKEAVATDRKMCTSDGNCHWNLFHQGGSCWRYLGTVSAAAVEALPDSGAEGFHHLAGWWQLSSGGRSLRQEYHFRYGAYRLVETLVCREQEDDRVLCASDSPSSE